MALPLHILHTLTFTYIYTYIKSPPSPKLLSSPFPIFSVNPSHTKLKHQENPRENA
ncbi:hypothetical protein CDL12_07434 [Handroanthus impetiginosus]|uniref:Uncharacterized protein n=1 Tax=Handroanthus impetiginosus TaxID=429701 RepID=A0A2G9HQU9_9LAMI|nr:hypothetical protein CDL12_07434 [Handroanthus impetiginosus]